MTRYPTTLMFLLTLTLGAETLAQQGATRQDHKVLRQTVEDFLQTQSAGLPGKVTIRVGAVDPRLNLTACAAPQAYLPQGSRAWGNTMVGVRCTEPASWNVYISATVRVQGEYVVATRPLAQGQSIEPNQLTKVKGDLTALPPGIVGDPSQAVGRTMAMSVPAGTPLRLDALRTQQAIRQGQTVRLEASGPGFKVSSEARALNNANDGQITQARTANGQVVSGVARLGGVVEMTF